MPQSTLCRLPAATLAAPAVVAPVSTGQGVGSNPFTLRVVVVLLSARGFDEVHFTLRQFASARSCLSRCDWFTAFIVGSLV